MPRKKHVAICGVSFVLVVVSRGSLAAGAMGCRVRTSYDQELGKVVSPHCDDLISVRERVQCAQGKPGRCESKDATEASCAQEDAYRWSAIVQ